MTADAPQEVTLAEATRVWAKIGWLGFGGPAGQIALMHRELVEKRRWISDERFLHALNYCMLLPGPEAQQLSIYIGWLMHRMTGGVIAGTLFVVPGIVVIGALSWIYVAYQHVAAVTAVFFGLKAAVLAIVVEAVVRIGRRALKTPLLTAIATAAFVGIYFFRIPFPLVVASAALIGIAGHRSRPNVPINAAESSENSDYLIDRRIARGELAHVAPSWRKALFVIGTCIPLWFAPTIAAIFLFGPTSVFAQLGAFFSETAVVTFGGAYAVLAYIAQRAVETYGWLSPGEMLDGLALAETTPGPLIMVVQFVGFLAAFRHAGTMSPTGAAILGSLLVSWVTFAPCFLWVFLGAPYVEALRSNRTLHAALTAVTAAIVGVILNLSVWFAVHTVFHKVDAHAYGPLRVDVPVLASLDPFALLLAAAALIAMLRYKIGMGWTLAGCALVGAIGTLLRASLG